MHNVYVPPAATDNDISLNSSVSLTFLPGSDDGAEVCTPIIATADQLVECEEDFSVTFCLTTVGSSLSMGNSVTAVTLIDSDGMYMCLCVYVCMLSSSHLYIILSPFFSCLFWRAYNSKCC